MPDIRKLFAEAEKVLRAAHPDDATRDGKGHVECVTLGVVALIDLGEEHGIVNGSVIVGAELFRDRGVPRTVQLLCLLAEGSADTARRFTAETMAERQVPDA